MNIDVSSLGLNSKLKVDEAICTVIPHDYRIKKEEIKIDVTGQITNLGDFYLFEGEAKTVLEFECDLCLDTVNYLLSFPIIEKYNVEKNEDEDVWEMRGKIIELDEVVLMNLFLNIPIKYVCSDDCRGLCQICGQNLNKADCNCDRSPKNSFFEGLKSLFDEEV